MCSDKLSDDVLTVQVLYCDEQYVTEHVPMYFLVLVRLFLWLVQGKEKLLMWARKPNATV